MLLTKGQTHTTNTNKIILAEDQSHVITTANASFFDIKVCHTPTKWLLQKVSHTWLPPEENDFHRRPITDNQKPPTKLFWQKVSYTPHYYRNILAEVHLCTITNENILTEGRWKITTNKKIILNESHFRNSSNEIILIENQPHWSLIIVINH